MSEATGMAVFLRLPPSPPVGGGGGPRPKAVRGLGGRSEMFQPEEETRDPERLERLQLERLRATVARIAALNPRYHRHLGAITPGDVASLADLRALPFLTKND